MYRLKWIKSGDAVHVCVLLHAFVAPGSQSQVPPLTWRNTLLGVRLASEPQVLSASPLALASESRT